jgi:hypothetical protein
MSKDLTQIFIWTEVDHRDDAEGVIAVISPLMPGVFPLMTRRRDIAEGAFAELAEEHRKRTGHRVRLVHWTAREDVRELP